MNSASIKCGKSEKEQEDWNILMTNVFLNGLNKNEKNKSQL